MTDICQVCIYYFLLTKKRNQKKKKQQITKPSSSAEDILSFADKHNEYLVQTDRAERISYSGGTL